MGQRTGKSSYVIVLYLDMPRIAYDVFQTLCALKEWTGLCTSMHEDFHLCQVGSIPDWRARNVSHSFKRSLYLDCPI